VNGFLFALLLTAASPTFEAETLDGRNVVGVPIELTSERLTLAGKDRTTVAVESLLTVSPKQKPTPGAGEIEAVIETADGGVIRAKQYTSHERLAQITLADGAVVEIPTAMIQTVRCGNVGVSREADPFSDEWTRLTGEKNDSDLLVVRGKDNVDYQKGVLRDVTEKAVSFDLDGEVLSVNRAKIYGFIYHHSTPTELPAAICKITDAAGSVWPAKSASLADGKLQWTTPAGIVVSQPLDAITKIDFSAGKLVYLSDLEPVAITWTPYFGVGEPSAAMKQFYKPRFDVGFDSKPLRLGGVAYRKGLAIRARTEIVYRLPEGFNRFQATVGIDDAVRPAGKVRLLVQGDDKTLLKTDIAGIDAPRPINLALNHSRRLTVVVDFSGGLASGDHLLLGSARVSK
jgi:hypothetical protein